MSFELPQSVRGFHDYFKMAVDIDTLINAFGYTYQKEYTALPYAENPKSAQELTMYLQKIMRIVQLDSESARREFLIAPVLIELATQLQVRLRTEQTWNVSPQLRGSLDYLLHSKQNLLVIEAKHADTTRGFKQLCVELIALDKSGEFTEEELYGAVSIGNVWQFAILDRTQKLITEDLKIYTVPDGLHDLMAVLFGILGKE